MPQQLPDPHQCPLFQCLVLGLPDVWLPETCGSLGLALAGLLQRGLEWTWGVIVCPSECSLCGAACQPSVANRFHLHSVQTNHRFVAKLAKLDLLYETLSTDNNFR